MPLIALIDDRQTNRSIFSHLASTLADDAEIITFADGMSALADFERRVPDLVISDFNMPGLNGAEFTRAFRRLPHCSDIPVVVITVHSERKWKLEALEAGATDFLSSPVDPVEFVTRGRNLLKLRQSQLQLAQHASSLEGSLASSKASQLSAEQNANRQLVQVIDSLPVIISAVDRHGKLLFANATHRSFYGSFSSLRKSPEKAQRSELSALDRTILSAAKTVPPFEQELYDGAGTPHIFLTQKSPLRDGKGQVIGVLTSGFDITERKLAEDHLQHLAESDFGTNLPDQVSLMRQMRKLVLRARRDDQNFALHIVRLRGIDAVNRLLGHSVDNHFLKVAAERLSVILRDSDRLAQLDDTTLAILQANITGTADAQKLAERVQSIVRDSSALVDHRVSTSATIGIALYPEHSVLPDELMFLAEMAVQNCAAAAQIALAQHGDFSLRSGAA